MPEINNNIIILDIILETSTILEVTYDSSNFTKEKQIEIDIYYICFLGQAYQVEKIYKSNTELLDLIT